jgi:hypothetical protein
MNKYLKGIASIFIGFWAINSNAQISTGQLDGRQNTITSAVPFLLITPNARAGAMGDAGVATPNDPNAIHWNAAKMVFNEKNGTVSMSYNPWLRQLVPDVSLSYLSIMGKINDKASLGGSLRYFSLGEIQFTDVQGSSLGKATPSEWAADLAYAQKLSDNFSLGVAFRFIYSNIAGGAQTQSQSAIRAGTSYAADITAYYKNKTKIEGYKINYGIGGAITNIGSKLTYTTDQNQNFIPINWSDVQAGIPLLYNYLLDKYNLAEETPSRKIYISRKSFVSRDVRIDNEEAIENYFIEKGFEIVYPENIASFKEQFELLNSCSTLAALSGSGLTGLLFMQENQEVIEIVSELMVGSTTEDDGTTTFDYGIHDHYKEFSSFKKHKYVSVLNMEKQAELVKTRLDEFVFSSEQNS